MPPKIHNRMVAAGKTGQNGTKISDFTRENERKRTFFRLFPTSDALEFLYNRSAIPRSRSQPLDGRSLRRSMPAVIRAAGRARAHDPFGNSATGHQEARLPLRWRSRRRQGAGRYRNPWHRARRQQTGRSAETGVAACLNFVDDPVRQTGRNYLASQPELVERQIWRLSAI